MNAATPAAAPISLRRWLTAALLCIAVLPPLVVWILHAVSAVTAGRQIPRNRFRRHLRHPGKRPGSSPYEHPRRLDPPPCRGHRHPRADRVGHRSVPRPTRGPPVDRHHPGHPHCSAWRNQSPAARHTRRRGQRCRHRLADHERQPACSLGPASRHGGTTPAPRSAPARETGPPGARRCHPGAYPSRGWPPGGRRRVHRRPGRRTWPGATSSARTTVRQTRQAVRRSGTARLSACVIQYPIIPSVCAPSTSNG